MTQQGQDTHRHTLRYDASGNLVEATDQYTINRRFTNLSNALMAIGNSGGIVRVTLATTGDLSTPAYQYLGLVGKFTVQGSGLVGHDMGNVIFPAHGNARRDVEYAGTVKRVLITGMSGTGKSSVIRALAARGYEAVDLDSDEWSHWVSIAEDDAFDPPPRPESEWQSRDWVCHEDRVAHLLAGHDAGVLFVSGTTSNQGRFHRQFDHIVLRRAPTNVLVEPVSSRVTNDYGKEPDELARVLRHVETVEPLLR